MVIKRPLRKEISIEKNSQISRYWAKNSKFRELLTFLGSFPELLQFSLYSDDLSKELSEEAQMGLNLIMEEYEYLFLLWKSTCLVKIEKNKSGKIIQRIYADGTVIHYTGTTWLERGLKRTDFIGNDINFDLKKIECKYENVYYRKLQERKDKIILNFGAFEEEQPEIAEALGLTPIDTNLKEMRDKLRIKNKRNEKYIVPTIYNFVPKKRDLITNYPMLDELDYNPRTGEPRIRYGKRDNKKFFNSD